jgi:hypothetical protein
MVPALQGLTRSRVAVEGCADITPIGPVLRWAGILSNLDLSSRRADTVADPLVAPGTGG